MRSMFLAEGLKIERPESSDHVRNWGKSKDSVGLNYKILNRVKQSIPLERDRPRLAQPRA